MANAMLPSLRSTALVSESNSPINSSPPGNESFQVGQLNLCWFCVIPRVAVMVRRVWSPIAITFVSSAIVTVWPYVDACKDTMAKHSAANRIVGRSLSTAVKQLHERLDIRLVGQKHSLVNARANKQGIQILFSFFFSD